MSQHEEFPALTPVAKAACEAGCRAALFPDCPISLNDRRYLAAFLREALRQVVDTSVLSSLLHLDAIAENLHSPQPPPPTLAEARAADLGTPEGKAVVRAFLTLLGEGGQP